MWHRLSDLWPVQSSGHALTRGIWSAIETFASAVKPLPGHSATAGDTNLTALRGQATAQRWVSLRTLRALCAELGYTVETNVPKSRWHVQRPLA